MKKIIIESKTYGTHEVLLDDEDYDRLNEHKWCVQRDYRSVVDKYKFYVVRSFWPPTDSKNGKRRKSIRMHREITNAPKGKQVDHINGNPLDNRKENLRVCSQQENCMNRRHRTDNRSGYKGVSYMKKGKDMINERSKPWRAYIKFNHKQTRLGTYKTKEQAARAYDKKAIELFGEYAHLNFPRG
jgi:hypothetical protein